MNNIELTSGNQMPFIGLGTSMLGENEDDLLQILNLSLSIGYRMFDTANGYNNEQVIGRFLNCLPLKRSEVFISSKLNDNAHSYRDAIEAIEKTLERLNTDYLDLFLVHNPNSDMMRNSFSELFANDPNYWIDANSETWRAFEDFYKKGIIRSIGVSNFEEHHLRALIKNASIAPMVNQIRYCIGCYKTQEKLIDYCKSNSIVVQGYSPFGKGNALKIHQVQMLAQNFGCSSGDIILNYMAKKLIPIVVKSSTKKHLTANLSPKQVDINQNAMDILESCRINEGWAKVKDPDTGIKYN